VARFWWTSRCKVVARMAPSPGACWEPWLRIDGISGTSAGAMNAAVLVDGYAENGANGARAVLENFWQRVSRAALLSPLRRSPFDVLLGRWTLARPPIGRRAGTCHNAQPARMHVMTSD
jgi:hypothetical protein